MCPPGSTVERELARIASASYGVVTRVKLLSAGVSADEIRSRVRKGGLIRVHRGVYRVGHRAPIIEATYWAAVLARRRGRAAKRPGGCASVRADERHGSGTRGHRTNETAH